MFKNVKTGNIRLSCLNICLNIKTLHLSALYDASMRQYFVLIVGALALLIKDFFFLKKNISKGRLTFWYAQIMRKQINPANKLVTKKNLLHFILEFPYTLKPSSSFFSRETLDCLL